MDLDHALHTHLAWKAKFRTAIERREQVDAGTIGDDNCCALGLWLSNECKSMFGTLSAYGECVKQHSAFHEEAGNVARAINAGDFERADEMISAGSPYSTASGAVGLAIAALRRQAAL